MHNRCPCLLQSTRTQQAASIHAYSVEYVTATRTTQPQQGGHPGRGPPVLKTVWLPSTDDVHHPVVPCFACCMLHVLHACVLKKHPVLTPATDMLHVVAPTPSPDSIQCSRDLTSRTVSTSQAHPVVRLYVYSAGSTKCHAYAFRCGGWRTR